MVKTPEEQALQINTLEILMEQNNKDHQDLKSMILALGVKLDDNLERMEDKFGEKANKWVESGIKFIYTSAAVVFIGLLVRWIVLLDLK